MFVQFLSRSMKSVQSIRNYVNGVKVYHILCDVVFLSLDNVHYKLTLRGLGKLLFHTPKQASPITPYILFSLFCQLDMKIPLHDTMWCMFLICFYTMTRNSTIAPPTVLDFDQHKFLCRKDFMIVDYDIQVRVKYSKTNQFVDRTYYTVPLMACPPTTLCPVKAYNHMCKVVPAEPDSSAVCIYKNGHLLCVDANCLDSNFKKRIRYSCVIDPES